MSRMGERREPHHAERHTETLQALRLQATARALEALIERTAPART